MRVSRNVSCVGRDSDRKCEAMKRATESETVVRRASNRLYTANKRFLKTDSETVARRASNRLMCTASNFLRLSLKLLHVELVTGCVLLTRELLKLSLKPLHVYRASDKLHTCKSKGWFTSFCSRCVATRSVYEMIWTHVVMQE